MECVMDHIVLNVEDDRKMITFYSTVLMLPTERLEEFKAGKVPFPSVRLNKDSIIDLFPKRMWQGREQAGQGRSNLNHLCMAMKKGEWDHLLQRLREKGIHIEEGPVPRWGAHGAGTSVYFRDPEYNLIEARYYDDSSSPEECCLGS